MKSKIHISLGAQRRWHPIKIGILLLAVSALSPNSKGAQTNALQTDQLAFALSNGDDIGDDKAENAARAKIWGSINSAGPEIIPLLAATIREYKQHLDFLDHAYYLLSEKIDKFGVRDNTCRDIVLENIDYLIKHDPVNEGEGLPTILTTLLGKCGRTEDAPILLDVMRNNENPHIKLEAAKSLAKIGDGNTLIAMKKMYAELQTVKIVPQWQQRERYYIKTNNTFVLIMNPHFNPLRHPYLDHILVEISNLEARVVAKTTLPKLPVENSPQIAKSGAGSEQDAQGFTVRAYVPLAWLLGAVVLVSGALIFLLASAARKRKG